MNGPFTMLATDTAAAVCDGDVCAVPAPTANTAADTPARGLIFTLR